jgi:alkylation response protein AidB-like acyl-CoA dehydrogenase
VADVALEIESARLLVYNAARLRGEGRPFVAAAAMAKLAASRVAERAASQVSLSLSTYVYTVLLTPILYSRSNGVVALQ